MTLSGGGAPHSVRSSSCGRRPPGPCRSRGERPVEGRSGRRRRSGLRPRRAGPRPGPRARLRGPCPRTSRRSACAPLARPIAGARRRFPCRSPGISSSDAGPTPGTSSARALSTSVLILPITSSRWWPPATTPFCTSITSSVVFGRFEKLVMRASSGRVIHDNETLSQRSRTRPPSGESSQGVIPCRPSVGTAESSTG